MLRGVGYAAAAVVDFWPRRGKFFMLDAIISQHKVAAAPKMKTDGAPTCCLRSTPGAPPQNKPNACMVL